MSSFRLVDDGVFIGPQPTPQDLEDARRQGVKTVIDFRLPSETSTSNETLVRSQGLDYENIPVDKAMLSANRIGDLDAAMQSKPGPFLLHCATGLRAALLLALSKAQKNGGTAEQTFAHAQAMGFDLRTSPAYAGFVTQTLDENTGRADQSSGPKGA